MPYLVDLIDRLSLDVTRGLVQQGLGLGFDGRRFTRSGNPAPLGIIDATNASPIVLTCDRPHGIAPLLKDGRPRVLHAIVSGVLGNTAANAIDPEHDNRTLGLGLGVALTPLDATRFSMALPDPATGFLAPLAGNGNYTGGGTIVPAFTEGRILFGREHTRFEQSAPPYMAIVPIGSEFGPRATGLGAANLRRNESKSQREDRPIATDNIICEVHTWGAAHLPDPAYDFDFTQRMYQQFFQSVHLLGAGSYKARNGTWEDQKPRETQIVKLGHYTLHYYAIATPVLEFAMPFVPPPLAMDPRVGLS